MKKLTLVILALAFGNAFAQENETVTDSVAAVVEEKVAEPEPPKKKLVYRRAKHIDAKPSSVL